MELGELIGGTINLVLAGIDSGIAGITGVERVKNYIK